jgi:hypothetical protein
MLEIMLDLLQMEVEINQLFFQDFGIYSIKLDIKERIIGPEQRRFPLLVEINHHQQD